MRKAILLITVVSSFLWTLPAVAQSPSVTADAFAQNATCGQVFNGSVLQYSVNNGGNYNPVPAPLVGWLRTFYACQITAPVALGQVQSLMFLSDQITILAYSSPDSSVYYVHRSHQVFVFTPAQWQSLVTTFTVSGPMFRRGGNR